MTIPATGKPEDRARANIDRLRLADPKPQQHQHQSRPRSRHPRIPTGPRSRLCRLPPLHRRIRSRSNRGQEGRRSPRRSRNPIRQAQPETPRESPCPASPAPLLLPVHRSRDAFHEPPRARRPQPPRLRFPPPRNVCRMARVRSQVPRLHPARPPAHHAVLAARRPLGPPAPRNREP